MMWLVGQRLPARLPRRERTFVSERASSSAFPHPDADSDEKRASTYRALTITATAKAVKDVNCAKVIRVTMPSCPANIAPATPAISTLKANADSLVQGRLRPKAGVARSPWRTASQLVPMRVRSIIHSAVAKLTKTTAGPHVRRSDGQVGGVG